MDVRVGHPQDHPDRLAATEQGAGSRRLTELQTEDRGVRTSFQVSYQELGDPAQRLFRRINLLDAADVGVPLSRRWPRAVQLPPRTCSNPAEATRPAGDPEQALAHFERAHQASRQSEATQTVLDAEIWWGLGRTRVDLGAAGTARECRRRSAAILHELGLISAAEKLEISAPTPPPHLT